MWVTWFVVFLLSLVNNLSKKSSCLTSRIAIYGDRGAGIIRILRGQLSKVIMLLLRIYTGNKTGWDLIA